MNANKVKVVVYNSKNEVIGLADIELPSGNHDTVVITPKSYAVAVSGNRHGESTEIKLEK